MNKVAFVTDTHFGCRGANRYFDDIMMTFFREQFFPKCCEESVSDVFFLGDFTDNRKQINFRTLDVIRNQFLPLLNEYDIYLDMIDGNHDLFYKDTNDISSSLIFGDHERVNIYKQPKQVYVNDTSFLMVPWINVNNAEETFDIIEKSNADYCLGHFEFDGAKMYSKSTSISGISPSIFSHFKKVLVGHFHHRNALKNIQYIGAAGYYTWQDYNDFRGFCLLDIDSGEFEYVQNEHSLFVLIEYRDEDFDELIEKASTLENKVLKVIVKSKENIVNYEKFIKQVYKQKLIDFTVEDETILESIYERDKANVDDPEDSTDHRFSDTLVLLKDELSDDVEKLEMENIYDAALKSAVV